MSLEGSRSRVVIQRVKPQVDEGRFPIRRVVGEAVVVETDIFADGHDALTCLLLHRREDEPEWREANMEQLGNDRWRASFIPVQLGRHLYTIQAWVDRFKTWRRDLIKRVDAGQDVAVELIVGAELMADAAVRAKGGDAGRLAEMAESLRAAGNHKEGVKLALGEEPVALMERWGERRFSTTYPRELAVTVDREKARYSAWYEMFPRSFAPEPGRHGTLCDCAELLPYVARMGFDVLYLPPIHPIGRTNRKGQNNTQHAKPGDVGSPWAIGSAQGGHTSIHPELGTLDDFRGLVRLADEQGIEIALDLAFQCTPDHPYVKEHPEWFRHRPDGTVQYAENPPKKYEDIYPFDFECDEWRALWEELKSVVFFWLDQGVRIFRVDNPHTKPFPFWEWLIENVKRRYPETIFLAEAFTRPKVMYELAKLGFTQSYTYFTWRNTKWEIESYFSELAQTGVGEFFRPNLWPNTPDILTEYLQLGGPPAFMVRLMLAATLGACYGIYGPAFELCENEPREPGGEEYLNSEKYEIRRWELTRPDSLGDFIARINRIRRENPSLHSDRSLAFHPTDTEQLICYSKHTADLSNIIIVVINLDPHHTHAGWLELPLDRWGLDETRPYQVHDLLTGARFIWQGRRNYVELDPRVVPGAVFRLRRRVRTERDFDYFM